ncbi:MAG TPA: cytidine deaminase [Bacteroidia bacterium]|nr:cytidine deaminase [Bacteroidota bacterium]HRC32758.1 cytidine deaminase [Bacteroidia bacterium]
MQKFELKTEIEIYNSVDELNASDALLMQKAIEATRTAYAPYSNFNVGAAVLLENGEIVSGSNQENAAYPSGLCAERVAVFYSGAHYPNVKIKAIAVTAFIGTQPTPTPVSPCGDCRQVMAECEHRYQSEIRFIMVGDGAKIFVFNSVKLLLPFMFNADSMK